jgi:hypothetical protein
MPRKVTLGIGRLELSGELNDSAAGQAMARALPIECRWTRWGDEYYGTTRPVFGAYPGEATDRMAVGDLAYHAESGWLCLFFGPTPASTGPEPRAAVPVQKVGRAGGDLAALRALGDSVVAVITAAD